MNKKDFAEQIKARKEEIKEFEDMVQAYQGTLGHVQAMVKASMVIAYRKGFIDMLDHLDQKAIKMKQARDTTNKLLEETRS